MIRANFGLGRALLHASDVTVRYTDVYCLTSAHTAESAFAVHMTVALILGPPTVVSSYDNPSPPARKNS